MPKKLTTAGLVKKLDRIFSRYVRMKSADEGGTVSCVTCGKLDHWKDVHASHFVSRRHMSVRFDERNVHPACVRCNVHLHGALDNYAKYILDTYGGDVLHELISMKYITKKWTREELENLISKYEQKVKGLPAYDY